MKMKFQILPNLFKYSYEINHRIREFQKFQFKLLFIGKKNTRPDKGKIFKVENRAQDRDQFSKAM